MTAHPDELGGGRRPLALAPQRHALILERVTVHGGVRVSELSRLLGVSDMTVRRDLDVLARQGLVTKVHGGATVPQTGSADEPGFEVKAGRETAEKQAVAAAAVRLVEPGSAVALTAGSTTWRLAVALASVPALTVVTNSVRVGEVLHQTGRSDQTVVLTGGVRTPSDALVGPVSVDAIRTLHVDAVFMGVHGLDGEAGLTTPNLLEAETNRAFVAASRRLVVLADHTKWGIVGFCRIAPLDAVDTLVVDDLPLDARGPVAERVRELVLAAPAAATSGAEERSGRRMRTSAVPRPPGERVVARRG